MKSLTSEISKWTEDRSNGDPLNLSRSIRLFYTVPVGLFGAVGIRQGWKREHDWVVIASLATGRTVEAAIRAMLAQYWAKYPIARTRKTPNRKRAPKGAPTQKTKVKTQ